MNYKEALFFIAKSLTILTHKENKKWVEKLLKNKTICWDKVVKQSTYNYVLPALYNNLKKSALLRFLPKDLVEYMSYITNLNYLRNKQIIKQAKEINTLLLKHNIAPIFVKGTGFILQGIYSDISDRMIGDLDFLVSKKDAIKAYIILVNNGYSKFNKDAQIANYDFRHLPRLVKEDKIAAVEIHSELIVKRYRKEFSYKYATENTIKIDENFAFLSLENQVCLTIIATQVNDGDSIYYKKIALRNAYDIYLLSKKTNTYNALKNFKTLYNPLNNYLAISKYVFNSNSIKIKKTLSSIRAIKEFNKVFFFTKNEAIKRKIYLLKLSFIDSRLRNTFFKRLARKSWRNQKLIELGIHKKKLKYYKL